MIPMKLAQMRLDQHMQRPNVELVRDAVQLRIVAEVAELDERI